MGRYLKWEAGTVAAIQLPSLIEKVGGNTKCSNLKLKTQEEIVEDRVVR